jgi:pimeloyl-ACP methyl ester carboxylesterase
MAWFDIGGGRLFYEQHGGGDLPLVFVHGFACAHQDWRSQVSHFAPSHPVVSLDQRGHGQSVGFGSGFDIGTFAGDLIALVARLALPPVVLVGHSLGCRVVLECARVAHASVAGLVLIDGSRFAASNGERARRDMRRAIEESGYQAFFERIFRQMFTATSDVQTRDAIIARALGLPRVVGLELMPQMVAWDGEFADRALTSAKMPVTVLQSTYLDESRNRVSLKMGETSPWLELVKERVPHGKIVIVPDVGHFTMIEAADVVNRHLEALLEKIAGS